MLGTSSAGTETLKNLVLPGCGRFIVVDDYIVQQRDLGNDFFVTGDSVGKPKAEVVTELLAELNPDVKGSSETMSVQDYLAQKEETLSTATLIILNDADQNMAASVCKMCEANKTSLIVLRQYGMLGYVRLYKSENCIIEPKLAQQ